MFPMTGTIMFNKKIQCDVTICTHKQKNIFLNPTCTEKWLKESHLHFSRKDREGMLQVDKEPMVTVTSELGAIQLDTDGFLWIGK